MINLPVRSTAVAAAAVLLSLGSFQPLHGQEVGRITGRIVDAATGQPLAGVQVLVPPGIGNITDQDGRFLLLNVPRGEHAITAQLIGYGQGEQQITVPADDVVSVQFELTRVAIDLEEIVVTGAGVATERRRLGNTIATIDATAIENAPITDFSQILQGREPGVVALPSSGFAGEGARIRIRGSASLSQLNEPIFYVDGIRVDRSAMARSTGGQASVSRLDDIPPEAIERVEILKGAAAATLYGTEASNGVVQIFTKKGRTGSPRFTFQTEWTGTSVPTDRMLPMADFARDEEDVARIQDRWGISVEPFEVFERDLLPQYFETGLQQVYSLSVTGGGDVFTYYVMGRWQDEDGPLGFDEHFASIPNLEKPDFEPARDRNERRQATANLTITPHEQVRIGVNTMYTEVDHQSPETSNNIYGLFSSALMSQLRLATQDNLYGSPAFATTRETMYQYNEDNAKHFTGSVDVNYTPLQNLTLDGTFGVDFVSESAFFFRPFQWNVDGFSSESPEGTRGITEVRNHVLSADFKLSWESQPTDDISNTFLAGTQGWLRQRTDKGGTGERFPGPGIEVAEAGADVFIDESWVRNTQVGGYVQDQIGWRDWAFLTLGGRWDANSAFGEDFSTVFYPKAGLSLMPTEALGWDNPTLSTVRLRVAVGRSGLQPDAFDKFITYESLTSAEGPGVVSGNLGNDALKPEIATEWEFGTELGLFDDRASVDVTYWDRVVKDAIVLRQFPVTGGFRAQQTDNIGEVVANGWEIGVNGTVVQSPNFSLDLFASASYLHEEITDMGGAPPLKTGGSYSRYRNFLVEGAVEGYAPGAFFGAEVARDLDIPLNLDGSCTEPTREQALEFFSAPHNPSDFKPLVIGNSDFGVPSGLASHNCGEGSLLTHLGKPTPDWQGSFGFNIGFLGNFELNSLFEFKAGNFFVHDLSGEFRRANPVIGRNLPEAARLEATMMDPASTPEERLDAAIEWATNYEGLAPLDGLNSIKPADFIRWRELSLTYRLPASFLSRLGLSSGAVSLAGRHLWLGVNSAYPGMDPEGNILGRCNSGLDCNFLTGTEGWGIPIPRSFTFSTRFSF